MSNKNIDNADKTALQKLVVRALADLSALPQPVVRVSGPLTTGGIGYEGNLQRFAIAERKLREEGYTVFDYDGYEQGEGGLKDIYTRVPHQTIMEEFHRPILASGLLKKAFQLPGWEDSKGARWEHDMFLREGIEVEELPAEWFE